MAEIQGNTLQGSARVSIQTQSAWNDLIGRYTPQEVCHFTYHGTEGYRDGSFLIPFPRESFYNTRRYESYYKNYFRPVIRAMIDPVFNQDVTRDGAEAALEEFLDNADAAGTTLEKIIKDAQTVARVCGVSFVVVDNVASDEMPQVIAQAITARALPYCYVRRPQDVYKWNVDKYGALVDISFYHGKDADKRQLYMRWTASTWDIYRVEGQGQNNQPREIVVSEGTHDLGIIPVIPVLDYADNASLATMPDPGMYELARLCFALYNLTSDIRNMELNQSFSVFYVSDVDTENLTLGTNNAINCGKDSKYAPGFASPDSQHMRNLVENADKLREDIYRIAQQNGVIAVKAENSGIAKEWDFRAEESILRTTAKAAERLEYAIVDLFSLWTHISTDAYVVTYPTQFSPTHDADRRNGLLAAIREMPPDVLMREYWKEVARIDFKNKPDELKTILEMMDAPPKETTTGNDTAGEPPDNADGGKGAETTTAGKMENEMQMMTESDGE